MKFYIRLTAIFSAILIFQHHANATTMFLGGIDEAIGIAVENSHELRSEQARFGISESRVFTANSILNPVIISDNGIAEETYRLGVQIVIETASKRKKRTEAANVVLDITKEEINAKILDIKSKVRKAYIELYALQEQEKASMEILNTIDELLRITHEKQKKGFLRDEEILQIEITRINTENEIEDTKMAIFRAHTDLNLLLGHDAGVKYSLETPNLAERLTNIHKLSQEEHSQNLEKLQIIAYENRPELKIEQNNIKLAVKRLEIAKANRVPNLLLAGGPDMVTTDGTNLGAFIMGAFEVPVFNRQQGPIKEAVAQRYYSEKNYELQKKEITNEIQDAYSRIVADTILIEKYENKLLRKANEVVAKSKQSFDKDNNDIILAIMAQQAAIKVKYSYITLIKDYQNAISDLERAIGTSI
ncbi:MAG: TolC family protein [Candidatus Gastranaerophilales bacterium]|nr:TolC family protein [Candidatus Gastranaerophilales bacterium]